jgi:hypothetical protein
MQVPDVPQRLRADSINPGAFAIDSKPYNLTYGDWTVKFWQWLLSIPADSNPIADETGERCGENQSNLPVFFLAFSTGGGAIRECDVPAGKAILVPVNVVECSFKELPGAKTEEELHTCAREDESSSPTFFLSVNGREFRNLEKYRVHSEAFDLIWANNSIIQQSGPDRAVSDGYWIILEPLPVGEHQIRFQASLSDPRTGILTYSDNLEYNINVK